MTAFPPSFILFGGNLPEPTTAPIAVQVQLAQFLGMEIVIDQMSPRTMARTVGGGHMRHHAIVAPFNVSELIRIRRDHIANHRVDPDIVYLSPDAYAELVPAIQRAMLHERSLSEPALPRSVVSNTREGWRSEWNTLTSNVTDPAPARPPVPDNEYADSDVLFPEDGDGNVTEWSVNEIDPDNVRGSFRVSTQAGFLDLDDRPKILGLSLKIHECVYAYADEVDEDISGEERIRLLKQMRLKAFQFFQRRLREAFEQEKESWPEVWHRPLPEAIAAANPIHPTTAPVDGGMGGGANLVNAITDHLAGTFPVASPFIREMGQAVEALTVTRLMTEAATRGTPDEI